VSTARLRATVFGLVLAAAVGAQGSATGQAPALGDGVKIVLQVSEGSRQAKLALYMAKRDLDLDPWARVVVVAYGEGVQFLQSDTLFSDEGPKVAALAARGVVFKVCENSLRAGNLGRRDLLPRVEVVPSGTLEIARLQREGYAYIRP
jgi:intracellular sulfur oxidation DsrE/DsrF family protein